MIEIITQIVLEWTIKFLWNKGKTLFQKIKGGEASLRLKNEIISGIRSRQTLIGCKSLRFVGKSQQ